ncbi:MAG: D-2-hydroxyacid dehydrogenase [Clostridia bacterium]|nr:D-2-hydroxyacid dehydrogenase [Clostridia bacterium]
MRKILMLDRETLGNDIDVSPFAAHGELFINPVTPKKKVAEEIKDAEVLILNKVFLNEENLKTAKNLKLICLLATGYNNIDTDYCKKNNIAVCNVPGYSTKSVAQHTFAMALSLIENIALYDNHVKSGAYANGDTANYLGWPYYNLDGKTWGIIGLGNIGKEVAKIASAFGCDVLYYSTSGKNNNSEYKSVSLKELLSKSDVVSLHCPLNEVTDNLITYKELSEMKPSSIIVNVARGRNINEKDLAKALKENIIGGACIDVYENEPPRPDSPILDKEIAHKLILTPHIAWASVEARNSLVTKICENIESFYNGGNLNRVV